MNMGSLFFTRLVIVVILRATTSGMASPELMDNSNTMLSPDLMTSSNTMLSPDLITSSNTMMSPDLMSSVNTMMSPDLMTSSNIMMSPDLMSSSNSVFCPEAMESSNIKLSSETLTSSNSMVSPEMMATSQMTVSPESMARTNSMVSQETPKPTTGPESDSHANAIQHLPADNQTFYDLGMTNVLILELNTSCQTHHQMFVTVSPCVRDLHWAFYEGSVSKDDSLPVLLMEETAGETKVFSITTTPHMRYILKLTSGRGGGVAVSVRGEAERTVRLRFRKRSRRRLLASWEPSPIDPKSTTYCIVVSQRRNYTSLCAAQTDVATKENNREPERERNQASFAFEEYSNAVALPESSDSDSVSGSFEENQIDYNYIREYRSVNGRKRKSFSDPEVACIGTKTHYNIENLDFSKKYYVNVFAVGRDRAWGSLLASNTVSPKNSTSGKSLRENVPHRADVSEKAVFYFKASVLLESGIWVILKTCGGAADLEVLVRGKRLFLTRNIESFTKIFVPTPRTNLDSSSMLEWSSEERKLRYTIKVTPSRPQPEGTISIELTASTTRWGIHMPELHGDARVVRELRPLRSCTSVDIAFLPATHNATDVIRYCIAAVEYKAEKSLCLWRTPVENMQCIEHMQRPPARVLIERVKGLKPGKKYSIQLVASEEGRYSSPVPYNVLYADTKPACKDMKQKP